MKKISIFVALILILGFTVSANAVSVNKIVSKPVLSGELKVLSYLVFTKHKHFSMHDLRELLRNYRGSPSIMFLIRQMNFVKGGKYQKPGEGCIYYQYLFKNNKIVKQKTEQPICKIYFYRYQGFYSGPIDNFIPVSMVYHGRALANFVKRLLTLNNIYNNINSQGQHYETALYTAVVKTEYRTALVLLTDKNINPNITCLSRYPVRFKYKTFTEGDGTKYLSGTKQTSSPTALQVLRQQIFGVFSYLGSILKRKNTKYQRELLNILEKDK
ncbi:MAG: hypothetical protein EVJ48_01895 [Candidatus Acidulodesulfobacterium acidiphilum]|uniref:Uncharacterized protein n=1 Tax=Candidatus Acidulodesulfobacterium acidiphilum TaxID=2597224 RepID=A0A520XGE4_9DELT|nr:MAG: hypothetical protein EVJ48_01895 [Candidatus Acidulodesulfobacterium acidiphilum]